MVERISEDELRQLQHHIFLCRSKAAQYASLIPSQEDANKSLTNYLKKLAKKHNCDYKQIMVNGDIKRENCSGSA